MSLVSLYKNVKLESKLLINLFVILITFVLIIGFTFFYLNKTFFYIKNAETLINQYSQFNKYGLQYSKVQNYISESIISLSVNDQSWSDLIKLSSSNLLEMKAHLRTSEDTINYFAAKQNYEDVIFLYDNEIIPKIQIIKGLIADSSYTDFSLNQKLAELLNDCNRDFDKLNDNLTKIKSRYILRILTSYQEVNFTRQVVFTILFISIIPLFIFLVLFYIVFKRIIIVEIQNIISILSNVAKGDVAYDISVNSTDEIGLFKAALSRLLLGLNKITAFAKQIENGNFDAEFEPRGQKDELGIALLDMRKSLKEAKLKEIESQKEDEKRNWTANEISKYSDILRKNNNELSKLADDIILNLINTLNANQGGIFIINDDNPNNIEIELIAAYAFDRKKFFTKTIQMGEGLVGTCAIEKETIYLKEIPENYIEIISGLGNANPRNLILVPLKLEDKILGVVEMASFYEFEDYKIAFLEKVAENIAATLATAKINAKTASLLAQSQLQAEELASQEEEMRQNMEELQAIQEEAARQAAELKGVFDAINENTGTIEFSVDGIILEANELILKLLRLKISMISKKHHNTIISSEERDSTEYEQFWEDLRDGQTRFIVRRYFVAQEEIWLSEVFKPLYDNNGKLYKILAMYTNITESEIQKRKLEAQSIELIEFHEKMKINQEELKHTNEILEAKSAILEKALQKSKNIQSELNEKQKLMEEQGQIMKESLENLALAHEEMEMEREKLQKLIVELTQENENLKKQIDK
jgi:PAS domain S-box-containing protein